MELDPDRQLALAYVPAARRDALAALWRLDVTLGAVPATSSEPMVGRIRLAWWREALERLDREPPPPEPNLHAAAHAILPSGVTGRELAVLADGWEVLLETGPLGAQELRRYAQARGGLLFRYGARLLGVPELAVEEAGARWALVDLARRSAQPQEGAAALALARETRQPDHWPKPLRPLGMLAVAATRDLDRPGFERQGSPGRMLAMVRHRLTGR